LSSTIYHLDNVECRGNETTLVECDFKRRSNYCYGKSGVKCNSASDLECNETDVRLIDGLTPHDGRVEICFNGLWGSVCDDLWDDRDAQVVCRQLGYDGSSTAIQRHPVDSSTILLFYYLDNVDCSGNEDRLSECEHDGIGVHNCGVRYEEAGVECNSMCYLLVYTLFTLIDYPSANMDQEVCNDTDVRLVNGNPPQEGEVEICLNRLWGSVCSNRWDVNDAKVVCRQLGHDGPSFPLLHRSSYSSLSSTIYHLDNVECRGNETTLVECDFKRRSNYCYGKSGVKCNSASDLECNETDVRLIDGLTPHDGRRSAMRLMLDWLTGGYLIPMVEWRYVSMGCGVQCVMTCGMTEMHKWCVDN
jgi:hypothetical protein